MDVVQVDKVVDIRIIRKTNRRVLHITELSDKILLKMWWYFNLSSNHKNVWFRYGANVQKRNEETLYINEKRVYSVYHPFQNRTIFLCDCAK